MLEAHGLGHMGRAGLQASHSPEALGTGSLKGLGRSSERCKSAASFPAAEATKPWCVHKAELMGA